MCTSDACSTSAKYSNGRRTYIAISNVQLLYFQRLNSLSSVRPAKCKDYDTRYFNCFTILHRKRHIFRKYYFVRLVVQQHTRRP